MSQVPFSRQADGWRLVKFHESVGRPRYAQPKSVVNKVAEAKPPEVLSCATWVVFL